MKNEDLTLMSFYREDLGMLFELDKDLDKEMICYRGIEDLEKKVGYFLENPDERKAVSLAGQRRVRAEHVYEHRLAFIFDKMSSVRGV